MGGVAGLDGGGGVGVRFVGGGSSGGGGGGFRGGAGKFDIGGGDGDAVGESCGGCLDVAGLFLALVQWLALADDLGGELSRGWRW